MKKLVRMFDLDDLRWLVTAAVAILSFYAIDAAWRAQDQLARLRTDLAITDRQQKAQQVRIWEYELDNQDLASQVKAMQDERRPLEIGDDRLPTACEWGSGRITD